MTDKDWIDLGRRAVACRAWRWMPGMLAYRPGGIWAWRRISVAKWADSLGIRSDLSLDALFPDLRDPATVGCLLALVREALGEPLASVEVRQPGDLGCRACVRVPVGSEGWRVVQWWRASQDQHYSESAALVAALESAQGLGQSS